jgi:uncharacterized membrane protein YcaP (DUF421 family)
VESVLRALVIYVLLLLIFRITGKRSLAQITAFDFILLLIIGESTQQALLGDDFSVTNACIVIGTLMTLELGLARLKRARPRLDRLIDSHPLIIVQHGQPFEQRMAEERVDVDDVLTAARELHGLERLEQIKYAVLERSGGISIVPAEDSRR